MKEAVDFIETSLRLVQMIIRHEQERLVDKVREINDYPAVEAPESVITEIIEEDLSKMRELDEEAAKLHYLFKKTLLQIDRYLARRTLWTQDVTGGRYEGVKQLFAKGENVAISIRKSTENKAVIVREPLEANP